MDFKKEKNDIVGVDIDCVLTELGPTMKFMADYFDKPVASIESVDDYNLSNAYGVTDEESLKFWKEEEYKICKESVPSYERIQSIYDNFIGSETKVIIITSRDSKYRDVTEKWLKVNGIPYDSLIMTSGISKKDYIESCEFDYMIDDKDALFNEMKDSKTKMVCVDYEYNKDVSSELRMTRRGDIYYGSNRK